MKRYRKPYRLKKKKFFWKNRFFRLGILILLIVFGIFYLIFFHPFFQIKEIKISGNQKVSYENLKNLIEKKLTRKILFFSTKSIFLINFREIEKEIFKNFLQIAKVNFKRGFPQTIFLQVKEREPVTIFCQNENCFSLDKEGIVFEKSELGQDFFFLRKEDLVGNIKMGEKVIEEVLLSQILETKTKLETYLKISLAEVLVISEERFNAKTNEDWQIYFNPKGNLNWQLTKLKVVLEKEIPQEKRKNLEYIDLRFGNFAPYKYRD